MSDQQKTNIENVFQWITRGLIAIILYLVMNVMTRFETLSYDMQSIRTTNVLLKSQVDRLEEQNIQLQDDINNIFRNYELKLRK